MKYFLLSVSLALAGSALVQAGGAQQKGNWTVGDCIIAAMDIHITVPTDKVDLNKTIEVSVDPSNKNVVVGGSCGTGKNVTKQDQDHDDKSNLLDRNITLTITKNHKNGTYGVTHISGVIEVRIINKTNSTFVNFNGDFPTALLITPVNMSYTCESEQSISLNGTWKHGVHPKPLTTTTTTTTTTKKHSTTTTKSSTSTSTSTTTKSSTSTTTKSSTSTSTTTKSTSTSTTSKSTSTSTTTKSSTSTSTTTTTKSTSTSTSTTTKSTSTSTTTKSSSTSTTTKSSTSTSTSTTSTIPSTSTSTTTPPTSSTSTTKSSNSSTTTTHSTSTSSVVPKESFKNKNSATSSSTSTTTTTSTVTTTTVKPHNNTTNFTTSVKFSKIQIDAFRSNVSASAFQAAKDCATDGGSSNDLIPIIVGCVLAAMVVIVLVAYLIGRRYQANNYERMED